MEDMHHLALHYQYTIAG